MNSVNLVSMNWVIKEEGASRVKSMTKKSSINLQAIFDDLRLMNSDLGLADKIIFVEGPSDVKIFQELLSRTTLAPKLRGVVFAPLKETDLFLSRKAEPFVKAYCRLLDRISEVPIPYLFVIDSGGKTEEQIKGLRRQFQDRIRLLPWCEIENCLLQAKAILSALQEEVRLYFDGTTEGITEVQLDLEKVQQLLDRESKNTKMYPSGGYPGESWRQHIAGSKVLKNIYRAFNLEYSKVKNGPNIARYVDVSTFGKELESLLGSFLS